MKHKHSEIICFILTAIFMFCSPAFCEIVFRLDDYPAKNIELLELQNEIILLFKTKKIPLTVAVIPARLQKESDAVEFLKTNSAPALEIALHGRDHSNLSNDKTYDKSSEFSGLDFEGQLLKIQEGVYIFEELLSIKPGTFIPPFNTYDTNTVRAIKESGISCLSAGFPEKIMDYENLNVIPATCLLKDINNIKNMNGELYVVMFHEYDFKESGSSNAYFTLNDLNNLLDNLIKQNDLKFYTLSELVKNGQEPFNSKRINSIVPLLSYKGSPFFCFPAHWIIQLPKYYGTIDFNNRLFKKIKILGFFLDIACLIFIIASTVFINKRVNILQNKQSGHFVINGLRILLILSILFLTLHGVIKVQQGKSRFAYKYRVPIAVSIAFLIGTFSQKGRAG